MLAVQGGHSETVELLLHRGAKVGVCKTGEGRSYIGGGGGGVGGGADRQFCSPDERTSSLLEVLWSDSWLWVLTLARPIQ